MNIIVKFPTFAPESQGCRLNDMLILLDPAHGHNTPGKRSPDGQLLEYAYTCDLARRIVSILKSRGYDSELLVPEDDDIPLSERVRRVNEICLTYEPSWPAPTVHLPDRAFKRHPHLPPHQRRRKRLKMDECDRLELLHL